MLRAHLLGRPTLRVDGTAISLPTRRAVAVVAVALLEGGEVSRDHLAELLWGPGKRRNLRQELYWLRRAEGADHWLEVSRDAVRVHGRHDLEGAAAQRSDGPLLKGLEGLTPAFDDWLAEQRVRWAEQTGVAGLVGVSTPALRPSADPGRRVALLLSLCEGTPPPEVLAEAVDLDPLSLADILQDLEDAGVTEGGELVAAERWRLRGEVSPTVARVLHARMVAVLERRGGDPAMRAHHLEWAGDPRASAAWLDVGRRRADLDALRRALDAATDDLQRLEALLAGIEECRRRGERDELQVMVEALEALATTSQHPVILARTAAAKALLATAAGDPDATEICLQRAEEAGAARAYVAWARGAVLTITGQPAKAEPVLRDVLSRTARTGDERLRMQALNALGACRAMVGAVDDADALHHEALSLARRLGDRVLAVRLLNSLGANASRLGHMEAAAERFDEAVHLAEQVGDHDSARIARGNLGAVWLHLGRFGPARSLVTRAVQQADTPRSRATAMHLRGDLERGLGRDAEAAAWEARAAEAYAEAGDAGQAAHSRFLVARARCAAGELDLQEVRAALDALHDTGRDDLAGLAALDLAAMTADPDEAASLLPGEVPDTAGSLVLRVEALRLRVALLRGEVPEVPEAPDAALGTLHVARYRSAMVAAALEAGRKPGADALRERVRDTLEEGAEGLLTGQREALRARVEAWLADPVGSPGP